MLKIIITGERNEGKTTLLAIIESALLDARYTVHSRDEHLLIGAEHRKRVLEDFEDRPVEKRYVQIVVAPTLEPVAE